MKIRPGTRGFLQESPKPSCCRGKDAPNLHPFGISQNPVPCRTSRDGGGHRGSRTSWPLSMCPNKRWLQRCEEHRGGEAPTRICWKESTFYSSFSSSDTPIPALARHKRGHQAHESFSWGQNSRGPGWAGHWLCPVIPENYPTEFPAALSGHGIVESLGWEGPLKLIWSCEEQGHLHWVAEGEHFQGYVKHSRPGTAAGGEDPKAEPQQSQELWVTFPVGPGDSTAAPSGKGDWENTPQPFFQLEVFP